MSAVQRRHSEATRLAQIAAGNAHDNRDGRLPLAEGPDAGQGRHARTNHGAQQATPGKNDRDSVRHACELAGEKLHARANVDHVGQLLASGSAGALTKTGNVGVDADEQPLRAQPAERMRQASVTGAEVDGHPARKAGQEASESVIRTLEALAANEVHVETPEAVSYTRQDQPVEHR